MGNTERRPFFPLFVDMGGRRALIAGGGAVAGRRIKVLLEAGADITVVAPETCAYIERAASLGSIRLLKRKYQEGDVAGLAPFFVIAATNDRQVNQQIAMESTSLDIPVSVADCRDECTCYFPAIADNGNYIAGLVSKDGNHAGVKQMAEKIKDVL